MSKLQDLKRDCRVLESTLASYVNYFKRETDHYNGCSDDPVVPKNKGKKNGDYHEFIPSRDTLNIVHCLRLVSSYLRGNNWKALKFLDAGCGVGNIMLLAQAVGFKVEGIEYDTKTRRLGCKLLGYDKIKKGDIITFRGYKNYDVIYFYVPIMNREKMVDFLTNLKDKMKVGAFVISYNYFYEESITSDKRFKPSKKFSSYTMAVFQKIKK